ncbi:PAT complex subunit Asterix-like [Procambarus clarkii]|uniref:PAT complex subunit Asterix-like n=1 Tax=Procambarus clarkii TaxID=6728 RepID=UPI0037438EFC
MGFKRRLGLSRSVLSIVAAANATTCTSATLLQLKWCAWVALYCSCISFANSRVNDDTKQMLSSFMLSISAVVMSYLQNPQPMTPPWSNI